MKVYRLPPIALHEFDLGAVLYHANYFHLYQWMREAFIGSVGFPYHKLVAEGCHLAVTESGQKFHRPVGYGQNIEGRLSTSRLGAARVTFCYDLFDAGGGELLHQAWTTHSFVKQVPEGGFRPARLPADLRQALLALA